MIGPVFSRNTTTTYGVVLPPKKGTEVTDTQYAGGGRSARQLIVPCPVARCALSIILFAAAILGQTIALTDCTLIDTRQGTTAPHSTIVMNGDRIAARGPSASTRIPARARVVRGTGKFVIPGLWDLHVHVGAIEEDWFPLFLANGVTGLREMAASEENAPRQREYTQDVAQGRRIGPELLWTLFSLDAPRIAGPQQARAEVARRAAMGLSYIKIYNALSRDSYFAIADECRKRGLQMVGHIPDSVSASDVARAGQASVEHLDGILLACSRREEEARWRMQHGSDPTKLVLDTFDSAKANALLDSFRQGGVWQTPTLTIHKIGLLARAKQLPGDIPIQYARRDYLAAWPRESRDTAFATLDPATAQRLMAAYQDLVRRMNQRGVRIFAGTDTPFPYCIPGFALHDELALLVEAGLSPMAALKAATWSPAEFLHLTQNYGSVEPGKIADLVVLDADPLLSIRNTRRISAVIRRGRMFDDKALREMLARVETEVRKSGQPPGH